MGRVVSKEGMAEIAAFFDKRSNWQIGLTGGEPTIHPYFIEFCELLTRKHIINFITNFSWEFLDIKSFINKFDSSKVSSISASLQPQGEIDFDQFYLKVKMVKEAGFNIVISYVATPERVKHISKYFNTFKELKVPFVPLALLGKKGDKQYPEDYTENEKEVIRAHAIHYHTLNSLEFKMQLFSYERICSAGFNKIYIEAESGNIYPCQSLSELNDYKIGNVYNNELYLFEKPLSCPIKTCNCELFDELRNYTEKSFKNNIIEFSPIPTSAWNEFKNIVNERYKERISDYDLASKEKTDEIIRSLFSKDIHTIIIYTGSTHTQKLLSLITKKGFGENVVAIVDKDPTKWGTKISGVEVYPPEYIERSNPTRVIISSQSYETEIYEQIKHLEEKGIEIKRIYCDNSLSYLFADVIAQ